ncbi:lipopolysaccharide biosynthesis protein [Planomonospora sp. ID82291]|uniref:lipopolysaccharide biosynthesis protein n=1 Tax=Planomonospora sp. ID82291 TaxID=2738136 RepID=UPI0018C3CAA6|nr:polysaccharide biosynthesis C-terminal domain-containing protein [Planomonospora sp. ID82291]MBG0813892.1 polysaccharide biosynthesis C-terminal domain-containing protein [Planomonospora sp. ID82291]
MSQPGNLASMARGGSVNLIGAAVTGTSQFALVLLVATLHSAELSGAFFAATSVFLILGALCELGCDVGLLRWVPRHLALGRTRDAARCVDAALVPVAAVSVLVAAALFAFAPFLAAVLDGARTGQTAAMLRALAVFLPVMAAANVLLAATRAHGKMRPTVLIDRIGRPVAQIGGVALTLVLGDGAALLTAMWALPYLPALAAAAWWYRGLRRAVPPQEEPPAAVRALAAEYWRFTALRALARVCQTALQRADIVMVAALSSPRDAAVYTVASRFVVFGQLGTQAVQQIMQPVVSRQLALDDRAGAHQTFSVATVWTVLLTWPVYVTTAAAASLYLSLFAEEYHAAGVLPVLVLSLAMMFATAAGPVDTMLLMSGRSGLSLLNTAAALAIDVVLGLVLIPRFGVLGAAVNWAISIVLRNVLSFAQVKAATGMTPLSRGLAWATGATVLSFGGPLLLLRFLDASTPALCAGLVACATIYVILLWKIRERVSLTALSALLRRRTRGVAASPVIEEV